MNIFTKIKNYIINNKKKSIIIPLIIIGLIYYFFFNKTDPAESQVYVLGKVKNSQITDSITTSGQIISDNQVDLKSLVSGNISYIGVKNGSIINKDDRILTVESYDAQKTLRDAELSLQQAKLRFDQLSAPLDTYQKKILTDDIVSQENNIKLARINYLNNNLQLKPVYSFSVNEPTLSGSYNCDKEGVYKIEKQSENNISVSGLEYDSVNVTNDIPSAIGKCGLYLTFKSGVNYPVNSAWELNIPNKISSSFANIKNQYEDNIRNYNNKITQINAQLNKESVTSFDIASAKLSYQQALNSLSDAKHNLSNYSITAPFTGVLVSFTSNTGDYISQGSKVGTLVTSKKIVKIFVNETEISKIHIGQKAQITIDSIPDIDIMGDIIDIDALPTTDGGVITYAAKIGFESQDERLRIGLTTSIYIKIKQKDSVLNIPSSAIKSDDKGNYVEVLRDDSILNTDTNNTNNKASSTGKVRRNKSTSTIDINNKSTSTMSTTTNMNGEMKFKKIIPVIGTMTDKVYIETGETLDNNTEILSGLKEGDIIIVNTISSAAKETAPVTFGAPAVGGRARRN